MRSHPREVDARFAHGKVTNWFGGSSNASTQLLDEMHYRGLLRVVRRDGGTRVYAAREAPAEPPQDDAAIDARMDALVDILVNKYAPLLASGLGHLLSLLCRGVPQWRARRASTLARAKSRLAHARVGSEDWYWPATENPASRRWRPDDAVRLLTPFDPIVFDRRRFELFWGWPYRFEAYTPAPRRKLGYYALPLLWRDRAVGWGNLAIDSGSLTGIVRLHRGCGTLRPCLWRRPGGRARSNARLPWTGEPGDRRVKALADQSPEYRAPLVQVSCTTTVASCGSAGCSRCQIQRARCSLVGFSSPGTSLR